MSTAADQLYQEVVIDHKRAPRNFGTLPAPTHRSRGHNPQCGDELSVELNVAEGNVRDIRFQGHGCAICIASASMMSEAVQGRTVEEARQLQERFRAVLTGQLEPGEAQLGKLISLADVRRYPGRIKCALLGWHALSHALAGQDEDAAAAAVR
jgi:nitrogen fixation NifU-like protein